MVVAVDPAGQEPAGLERASNPRSLPQSLRNPRRNQHRAALISELAVAGEAGAWPERRVLMDAFDSERRIGHQ
jgi:hypothetical protein